MSRKQVNKKLTIKTRISTSIENSINWSFSPVQLLSCVQLFATPWIAALQASLSITNSQSLPKPMSKELVMSSSHLILCRPLLLLPPMPPSIRFFQWVNSSHEVAKVLEFQLYPSSPQHGAVTPWVMSQIDLTCQH